jgi:hypothetical protein
MHIEPNEPVHDWPLAAGEPGREVWYSLVSVPDGSVAFWYRYTLLSTEGGDREGRLWAALTDRETPANSMFASASVAPADTEAASNPFALRVGDGHLTSTSATGRVGDISWSLDYDPDVFAFTPLRSQRLTDALSRVAGTGKHWSRNESVSMSGEVTLGDRTVDFEGAPGHQGHTVTQVTPPENWTWVQCNDFAENDSATLEALRLDDTLSVCFRIDGEVYPLNRLRDIHPVSPWANELEHDEVGTWQFRAAGEGVELRATVQTPPDCWQHVTYKVPDGSLRYNAHCSLSAVTVTYSRGDDRIGTLTSNAGRAEWVGPAPPRGGESEYRPEW